MTEQEVRDLINIIRKKLIIRNVRCKFGPGKCDCVLCQLDDLDPAEIRNEMSELRRVKYGLQNNRIIRVRDLPVQ